MSDKEILQKAIKIAIENGWNDVYYSLSAMNLIDLDDDGMFYDYENSFHINKVLFNHEFAKAFFGGEGKAKFLVNLNDEVHNFYTEEHIFHLMKMVGLTNPIDYLRRFIDDTTENSESK